MQDNVRKMVENQVEVIVSIKLTFFLSDADFYVRTWKTKQITLKKPHSVCKLMHA